MQTEELKILKGGARDVLSACSILRSQWPFSQYAPQMPPTYLLNQIYSMIEDRTLVDREIATLQQENRLRVFKLWKEGHDLCLVLTEDYIASIRAMMPDGAISMEETDTKRSDLTRPVSLPSSIHASPPAASSSAPVKAKSAATTRFAPWPSSKATVSSAAASANVAASPANVPLAPPLPPKHAMIALAAASNPPAVDIRRPIKRKRSTPTPATSHGVKPIAPRVSSVDSISARDSTIHADKKRKIEGSSQTEAIVLDGDEPPPLETRASPLPSPSASPVPFLVPFAPAAASSASSNSASSDHLLRGGATGGVNPKLHTPLTDLAIDDRFPSLADDHPSKFSTHDAAVLLGLFLSHLVPNHTDISITKEKLLELIYQPYLHRFTSLSSDQAISCLLHLGLLLFKTSSSFFFSPPGVARLIGAVRNGRKEVCTIIKRRQYAEMTLRELMQVRALKTSPCRIEFHLREMLGAGSQIEVVDTTIGPVVKIVRASK